MKRTSLVSAVFAVSASAVLTSGCDLVGSSSNASNGAPRTARLEPAIQRALGAVGTVHEHKLVERDGERVVYHPGWSSRITVTDGAGRSTEIYRQTLGYRGVKPREVVVGFHDVAIALFDPSHRVAGLRIATTDGQIWSYAEDALPCPEHCPPGTDTVSQSSLMPSAARLADARLVLAPAERARASVSTGIENRVIQAAGERATYHPGWSSRIRMVNAAGQAREIYHQTRVYHGPYPQEVALGFRDVGLAVFDPNHRIRAVTAETLDEETWDFDENGQRCPPMCTAGIDSIPPP